MIEGFILLHKKCLEWEWHDVPNMFSVFGHLLLLANYSPKVWRSVQIDRGQVLTSMASLAKLTGMTQKQVRRCIDKLKSTGEVTTEVINIKGANQRANLATLITICNYDRYQRFDLLGGQTNGQSEGKARAKRGQHLNNKKEEEYITEDKSSESALQPTQCSSDDVRLPKRETDIDYNGLVNYWNDTMKTTNIGYVKSLNQTRRGLVNARVKEYGKDSLATVIQKVAASKFLNGDNTKHFIATFEWVVRPNNFLKILEGNYDN